MSNRYKYIDENKSHLHTLDLKPLIGTSSVLGIISKPLHWWALQVGLGTLGYLPKTKKVNGRYVTNDTEKRLKCAELFLNEQTFDDPKEWLTLLDKAYYAHSEAKETASDKGVNTHAMCEEFIKAHMAGKPLPYDEKDKVIGEFVKWTRLNVKNFIGSEIYCFSEKHWLGGISDGLYESKDGHVGVIDFKSSKEAYLSQFLQCALYDIQLTENGGYDRNGNQNFKLNKSVDHYIIFPFGAGKVEAQYRWDTDSLKVGALSALNIYKLNESISLSSLDKQIKNEK